MDWRKDLSITLDNKQCLIAGDGELPVYMAKNASESGFEVVAIALSNDNKKNLKKYCSKVYEYGPGELLKIIEVLKNEKITQLTFLGKVHKGLILRKPKFDSKAIEMVKNAMLLNDDAVMLLIIEELEKLNITVLDQTIFIKNLMVPRGVLGKCTPTEEQLADINYGFLLAKEMGKLDVGQSVVVKEKMVMAVEAIEGTDRCIRRGCRLAKKGGVVVKVSKPSQDKRFDMPAVGIKTLKNMKKYKASVIALEAGETIIVNQQKMIDYADKNNIVVMAL